MHNCYRVTTTTTTWANAHSACANDGGHLAALETKQEFDAVIAWMRTGKIPDSKVYGANMGPIWGLQDPGGPHVGPMNLAIWDDLVGCWTKLEILEKMSTFYSSDILLLKNSLYGWAKV